MTEPTPNFQCATIDVEAGRPSTSASGTWFRTRDGHRYGKEIALIIVVKLLLLMVLWFVFIKPWPRPATSPANTVQQFYLPTAPAVAATRHD